jgi:hypothetical protein
MLPEFIRGGISVSLWGRTEPIIDKNKFRIIQTEHKKILERNEEMKTQEMNEEREFRSSMVSTTREATRC